MTPTHAAAVLRQLTDWRRGVDADPPKPGEVLEAIDAAITAIERLEAAEKDRDALRAELETERMRLAACGVVALSNTPDSAKQAREMRPEYWSASCGDVARMVDENIKLRARIEAMEKQEPVRHEFQGRDGAWCPFINQRHYENTVADGTWPIRALYALPGAKGE